MMTSAGGSLRIAGFITRSTDRGIESRGSDEMDVNGLLFTTASIAIIVVINVSICGTSPEDSAVAMCDLNIPTTLSQTPPRCGFLGGMNSHSTPTFFKPGCRPLLIFWSSYFKSDAAARRLEPLSDVSFFRPGRREENLCMALSMAEASRWNTTSV